MVAAILAVILCVASFIRFMENHKYVSINVLVDMLSKHTFSVFPKKCFFQLTLTVYSFFKKLKCHLNELQREH